MTEGRRALSAALLCLSLSGCALVSPAIDPGALEARVAPAVGGLASAPTDAATEFAEKRSASSDADRSAEPSAQAAAATRAEAGVPRPRPPAQGAAAGALAPTARPTLPPQRALTLEDLLAFASQLSPRLRAMREQASRAFGKRAVAFSAFLPAVAANYRYIGGTGKFALPTLPTLVGNVAYGGTSDRFSQAELGIQWVVWDFGQTLGRFNQSRAGVDIAELELRRAGQTIAFDVTAAYFALLRAKAFRRIADQAVKRAESVLRDARNHLRRGTALREDVQRAEVQLAQMRLDLVRARTEEGIATAALNRAVGFHVSSPTAVADRTDESAFGRTLDDCLQVAVDNRDELRVVLRAIESAQQGRGVSQADFLPRVIVGGTGIHVDRSGPELDEDVFIGGARIELALFEGGRRIGELEAADAEVRLAVARGEETCDAIAFEVVAAYLEIDDARERIRLARVSVEHAKENLRVEEGLLHDGVATPTDMVDAELVLVRSEEQYYDALYGYQTALARMAWAAGTDRVAEERHD